MSESAVPAVVLAAGEGRRLDPLTNRRPKPMVPVANRPILDFVISAIADAGMDRIILVVGYRQERIKNYFGDGNDWNVDIEYVEQGKQLGTAHAILQAESAVDGPFLALNGDQIVDTSLVAKVRDEIADSDGPVMSVTRSSYASEYGIVSLDDNRVVEILEKPSESVTSEIINAGVYGFESTIFDAIRNTPTQRGELAITTTLERIADKQPIRTVRYRGTWLDVSYLWDLLQVNAAVIDERSISSKKGTVVSDTKLGDNVTVETNATVGGGTSIGDNVTIEANAVASNSVVFPDAVIESGAVVRDAIIAENARVGPNATIIGGESVVIVDGEVYEGVELGAVVGDNAVVGGGTTVNSGTVIGDSAIVDPGATVSGRIEPDAIVREG